ncbi:DUF2911 domain-containing protein [Flectobacillus major]|uniref:DUF2911 domain-containing protein n=1 Tax=Flectobacillus major TaxID=103 RepID=UPI000420ABAE|nr:DUF2911 domain-containing protein [Flectobacillus major]
MIKILRIVLVLLALLAIGFVGMRFYTKSFSPSSTAEFEQGDLDIMVEYCQPAKKGRLIFGPQTSKALVPYGKWWRTGANEATVITFTRNVTIAGRPLKAGTYTLFTIPEQNDWTIIINSEVGQWGLSYDETKDVLRVPAVSVKKSDSVEKFVIDFNEQTNGADMILRWDNVEVTVPIRTR